MASAGAGALLGCSQDGAPVTSAADAANAAAPIPPGRSGRSVPLELEASGGPVSMRFEFLRPASSGPHPLLIVHHGSTGRGDNPGLYGQTWFPTALAESFAASGWLVAAPQRRGRGGSGGRYGEGLLGLGYSNVPTIANAGLERALTDAQAASSWLVARPEVDAGRVLLVGQSRGGLLALVQAAQAPPPGLRGTLNFVGGWLSENFDPNNINTAMFRQAGRGAQAPAAFLYGEGDPFYSIAFSQSNFATFEQAGGRGSFQSFVVPAAPGRSGHSVISVPSVWGPSVQRFCTDLRLPPPAIS